MRGQSPRTRSGARIHELADEWPEYLPLIDTLRLQYEHRATHLDEERDGDSPSGTAHSPGAEQELLEHLLIRRALTPVPPPCANARRCSPTPGGTSPAPRSAFTARPAARSR